MDSMDISQIEQLKDIVVRQALPIVQSVNSSYSSIQASSHLSTESELACIRIVRGRDREYGSGGIRDVSGDLVKIIQEEYPIPIPIPIASSPIENIGKYIYGNDICIGIGGGGNRSRCSSHESIAQQIIHPEDRGFVIDGDTHMSVVGTGGTGVTGVTGVTNEEVVENVISATTGNGAAVTSDDDINVLGGNNEVDVKIRPDVKTNDVIIQICSCSIHCFS